MLAMTTRADRDHRHRDRRVSCRGGAWWMSRGKPARKRNAGRVAGTEAPIDKPSRRRSTCRRSIRWTASCAAAVGTVVAAELARWLATDDLVGQLAVGDRSGSAGASPARDFKVIAPNRDSCRRPRQPPHDRSGKLPALRRPGADRHVDRRRERRQIYKTIRRA
jgi:hypothetical protein